MPKIIPYQPYWPAEFQRLAATLRSELGELAQRIDHIGSTSVPGLAAKDIIDIQISVTDLSPQLAEALNRLGYTRKTTLTSDHLPPGFDGPASDWEKWFFSRPPGERPTNTHVRIMGRPNQRYPLLFRDYLRAHPHTATAYARLKHALAQNLADPSTYPDVKDPAVDLIYLPAVDWAKQTAWHPGPPDA
jgi:GrpB-like predicted nucleotidyltransferase (UPF0157 family)